MKTEMLSTSINFSGLEIADFFNQGLQGQQLQGQLPAAI